LATLPTCREQMADAGFGSNLGFDRPRMAAIDNRWRSYERPESARLVRCHGSRRRSLDRTDSGHSGSSVGISSSATKRPWERALGNGRVSRRCARCRSTHSRASNHGAGAHYGLGRAVQIATGSKCIESGKCLRRTAARGRFSSRSRENQAAGRATATNLFPSGSRR